MHHLHSGGSRHHQVGYITFTQRSVYCNSTFCKCSAICSGLVGIFCCSLLCALCLHGWLRNEDDSSGGVPVETAFLPPLHIPGFVFFWFHQNLSFSMAIEKKGLLFCFFDILKHVNDFFLQIFGFVGVLLFSREAFSLDAESLFVDFFAHVLPFFTNFFFS